MQQPRHSAPFAPACPALLPGGEREARAATARRHLQDCDLCAAEFAAALQLAAEVGLRRLDRRRSRW